MDGSTCEVGREVEGPKCKNADLRRGSKSLAAAPIPFRAWHHISLPHPSFFTSGRRHGQAGVVVRHPATTPLPSLQRHPSPTPTPTTSIHHSPPSPATAASCTPDQTRAARASGHPRERPRAAALSLFLPCCCSSTFLPLLTLLLLFYFFLHPRCPAPSLNLLLLSRFATPHVSTAASLLLSLAPPYCCYYSFPLLLSHLPYPCCFSPHAHAAAPFPILLLLLLSLSLSQISVIFRSVITSTM